MEAVGRLAGGIAHDFNNLLTVIRGDCELALAEVHGNDPVRFSLSQIRKASARASELTRRLMLFGRQKPMAPVRLDLNTLVADMLQMLDRLIGEDIAATIETEPGLMPVYADKAGIEQVIMNLVLNARDAMPDGGMLTIRAENADGQPRPGEFVRLSVSDTGIGIDRGALPYIFDPFYTGKEIGKGTGLGLSTAYGIVEQHGGWIAVESEPGKGSTFSVYLEAGERAVDGEAEAAAAYAGSVGAGAAVETLYAGARILLVEDEEVVSSFVARTLEKNGYEVVSAPGAEEALKLFEREKGEFNLVFTDVVLPDMSGIQLVERLHEIRPGLPVLVTSGYTDRKSQWPVIQERGYRFLEKPYDLPDLLNAVREAM
jgi:two-component system, cell cycle sensor histidine kinase and response regulator CckA